MAEYAIMVKGNREQRVSPEHVDELIRRGWTRVTANGAVIKGPTQNIDDLRRTHERVAAEYAALLKHHEALKDDNDALVGQVRTLSNIIDHMKEGKTYDDAVVLVTGGDIPLNVDKQDGGAENGEATEATEANEDMTHKELDAMAASNGVEIDPSAKKSEKVEIINAALEKKRAEQSAQ